MTNFTFNAGTIKKTLEIGLLPNPEAKMLSVLKSNSVPPLEKKETINFAAPKGIAISSVNQIILSKKGLSYALFRLTMGLKEYASRAEITDTFVNLILFAESLGQKVNSKTLKSALIEILDAQPNDQELNKQFDGEAAAEFYVGIPADGDPSKLGEITVKWNLNLKRVITSDELSQLNLMLTRAIKKGKTIKYSKQ